MVVYVEGVWVIVLEWGGECVVSDYGDGVPLLLVVGTVCSRPCD